MKKNQNSILFGLTIILIIGLVIMLYSKKSEDKELVGPPFNPKTFPLKTAIPELPPYEVKELSEPFVIPSIPGDAHTAEVATYRNKQFGFEFQYPSDYEIEANINSGVLGEKDKSLVISYSNGLDILNAGLYVQKSSTSTLDNIRYIFYHDSMYPMEDISHLTMQRFKLNGHAALRVLVYMKYREEKPDAEFIHVIKDNYLYTYDQNTVHDLPEYEVLFRTYFLNTFRFVEQTK